MGPSAGLEQETTVNQMPSSPENPYVLRLYVVGRSSTGTAALRNLIRFCETRLRGRYELRVVDVLKEPDLAAADGIVATPTLVKHTPEPSARVFGILANEGQLMAALEPEGRPDAMLHTVTQRAVAEI